MTLAEWTAAQEPLGKMAQYVLDADGHIAGHRRLAGDGDIGRFDLLAQGEDIDLLLDAAMAKLANRASLHAIVPEHAESVARRLVARGFSEADNFTVLARRTVRPVKQARAVPAVVQTTFG